ncbi:subtilisin-like protease SBT5.4 [Citrus sinensis]|uniref:subtilisin-like protease SBT5.4 n=1 Tax=Citrus sinensis TaxID=2711 RepID=UPI000763B9E7|nr:subtilisin-like protease SBT5.4 [Citrus sinensis]
MSCPHVAGIVGLLKALHHDWSPAMIRSAIMITARDRHSRERPILDYDGMQATPFAYGARQVSPNDAMDPGLVYELGFDDYLGYTCNRGYDQSKIAKFTEGKQYVCP